MKIGRVFDLSATATRLVFLVRFLLPVRIPYGDKFAPSLPVGAVMGIRNRTVLGDRVRRFTLFHHSPRRLRRHPHKGIIFSYRVAYAPRCCGGGLFIEWVETVFGGSSNPSAYASGCCSCVLLLTRERPTGAARTQLRGSAQGDGTARSRFGLLFLCIVANPRATNGSGTNATARKRTRRWNGTFPLRAVVLVYCC